MLVQVRRHPAYSFLNEITDFEREIDRLFSNGFQSRVASKEVTAPAIDLIGGSADDGDFLPNTWMPAIDLVEKDNEYVAKVELPGVNKDDVKITLQNNILTIKGEKKSEKETSDSNYHRFERTYGSFHRSLTLPTTVINDKVDAQYKDGVLTISLPKAEEAKRKQIEVKVK